METKNLLEYLCWVDNTSSAQMKMMFELCDENFEKLMRVCALRKKYFMMGCPENKQEIEELLKKPLY